MTKPAFTFAPASPSAGIAYESTALLRDSLLSVRSSSHVDDVDLAITSFATRCVMTFTAAQARAVAAELLTAADAATAAIAAAKGRA